MRNDPLLQAIVVFLVVGVGVLAWGIADLATASTPMNDVDGALLLVGGLGCGWFVWGGLKRRSRGRAAETKGRPPV